MAQKNKSPKIHKMFKKRYTQTHWERFLERCYNEADRDVLQKLFEKDQKNRYVLRKDLTLEEQETLAEIGKRIELGYSFLQVWKLIAVGVIFVGVALFLSLFQNKILENIIESSLSAVFDAKVDIKGVRLDISRLLFRFQSLTVGDSEEPYRNLFELGKTELKLNPQALTLGRVVIENAQCEDIRWNTPRTTPGTLPRKNVVASQKETEKKSSINDGFSLDFTQQAANISNLVASQVSNLKSLTLLVQANQEISNTIDQWTKIYDQKNAQITQLALKVQEIQKIQVSSLKTIEDAQKALSLIESFSKNVSSVSTDIKTTSQQFKLSYDKAMQLKKSLGDAITADKQYLQRLISLPVTDGKNILSGMLDSYLRSKLGKLCSYGIRALSYAQKITSDPNKKPKRESYKRLQGRTIPFPSDPYPSFLLKNLQSSVQTPDKRFAAQLQNISTDPYKWGKPILFSYHQNEKEQNYKLSVSMDIRSNALTPLLAEFSGAGIPLELNDLGFLKVKDFKASLALQSVLQWDKTRNTGKLKLSLSSLQIGSFESSDFLTKMFVEILKGASTVDMAIVYTMLSDGTLQLSVQSSLDGLIQKKIGEYLASLIKEQSEKIDKELQGWLQTEIAKNELLSKNLQGLNDVSLKSLSDVATYEELVDTKKKEVQSRIDQIKKEQEDALKKKAEEAAKNLNLPKIGK
jgi:uncharacterized protein (TIGR03545 family)